MNAIKGKKLLALIPLILGVSGLFAPAMAQSFGKPSAPIYITGVKHFSVEPDVETEILVQLDVSHYDSGLLTVTLNPDDHIVLVDTDTEYEFVVDLNTKTIEIPVRFYASNTGRYYLMFTAAMEDANFNVQAKSMGVVVDVGGQAQAQKQKSREVETTTASDNPVKPLPVEEKVY